MDTNELPCAVKDAEFIDQMGDYQLLKRIVPVGFCVYSNMYFNDFCVELQPLYKSPNIIPFQVKFNISLYFFTALSVEAECFV